MEKFLRTGLMNNLLLGLWSPIVIYMALRITDGLIWPTFAIYHLGCLLIPRLRPREAGFVINNWRSWLPLAGLISVLLLIANYILVLWLKKKGFVSTEGMLILTRINPWALFGLYILAVNPLVEEYYWRGFLQQRAGLFLTTTLFALMHYPLYALFVGHLNGLLACTFPFLFGLLWGWLRLRYSNLWPGVITHFAANAAMFVVATHARS